MLLPFSANIKVQQTQRDQIAVMSFLASRPSEFDTAKSHILSTPEISSLLLDIVQSFPLLSYCIMGPMSVYIYKSNI